MTDLIVLAMLLDGPRHGYQLKREAGFIFGHGDIHNNLVYPLLRRFAAKGWVTRKAVAGERGQTRQQYALTARGRRELVRALEQYSIADARSQEGFLARVGMFGVIGPEARARILRGREVGLQSRLSRLATLSENVVLGNFGEEVTQFLKIQILAELEWIGRLRRQLHKQRSASPIRR